MQKNTTNGIFGKRAVTAAILCALVGLCDQYGMFQISGEDINSPRQSFIIRAMENPMFQNLIDATWKLIEHEKNT